MADLPRVTVTLPRLVCELTGVPHQVEVAGRDTDAVVTALLERHPELRPHLLDDTGDLRDNVLCALDGARTRLTSPVTVRDGSTMTFVGSVAGG